MHNVSSLYLFPTQGRLSPVVPNVKPLASNPCHVNNTHPEHNKNYAICRHLKTAPEVLKFSLFPKKCYTF